MINSIDERFNSYLNQTFADNFMHSHMKNFQVNHFDRFNHDIKEKNISQIRVLKQLERNEFDIKQHVNDIGDKNTNLMSNNSLESLNKPNKTSSVFSENELNQKGNLKFYFNY